jgi:hypothetical protein
MRCRHDAARQALFIRLMSEPATRDAPSPARRRQRQPPNFAAASGINAAENGSVTLAGWR